MVLALKPLHDAFGLEDVNVVTMQAVSGSGYPGVPSMDIIDNVVPFIGGEEKKMESEPLKILGSLGTGKIETVQVNFKNKPSKEEIIKVWNEFKSQPQDLNLPSAPKQPIVYFSEEKYPQPKIHRNVENGMAASVGRLRECPIFDYKFIVLSHNTIRGAAGGTILIAELMKAKGYMDKII